MLNPFDEHKNRVSKEFAFDVDMLKEETITNVLFDISVSCNVSLYQCRLTSPI